MTHDDCAPAQVAQLIISVVDVCICIALRELKCCVHTAVTGRCVNSMQVWSSLFRSLEYNMCMCSAQIMQQYMHIQQR
jgi:hypothetical protein